MSSAAFQCSRISAGFLWSSCCGAQCLFNSRAPSPAESVGLSAGAQCRGPCRGWRRSPSPSCGVPCAGTGRLVQRRRGSTLSLERQGLCSLPGDASRGQQVSHLLHPFSPPARCWCRSPCPALPALHRQHPPSNSALLKEKGYCSRYANRANACSAVAAPFLTSGKCLHTAASGKSLHADGSLGLLAGQAQLAPCSHLFRRPMFSSKSGASLQEQYRHRWWLLWPARTLPGRPTAFSCY